MLKFRTLPVLAGAAALAVFALAQEASAATLTLTGPIQGNTLGPQSTSNPCIIAGTACSQPAGFGFNNFSNSGSTTSFNAFSTSVDGGNNGTPVADGVQGTPYTGAQIDAFTNNMPFVVAIDVNTSGGAGGHQETLQLFQVIVNGAVRDVFNGPALIGNIANNGNGFGDWSLGNIGTFAATDTVLFHAVWNNATDGAESFFIIGVPAPIIGDGVPVLLAIGGLLLGARFLGRSNKHRDTAIPYAAA